MMRWLKIVALTACVAWSFTIALVTVPLALILGALNLVSLAPQLFVHWAENRLAGKGSGGGELTTAQQELRKQLGGLRRGL